MKDKTYEQFVAFSENVENQVEQRRHSYAGKFKLFAFISLLIILSSPLIFAIPVSDNDSYYMRIVTFFSILLIMVIAAFAQLVRYKAHVKKSTFKRLALQQTTILKDIILRTC